MSYIMALDAGTTSNRCILFNQAGEMCSVAQKEFTQYFPRPGWVEHDANEIWTTQLGVALSAMNQIGASAEDIAAIGITNQRETTIVWDRDTGEPVCHAIVWQCRRTSAYCDELKARGLTGKTKDNVGNFYADLVRITTRVLLPFSLAGGLLLVWQGVPQNFSENVVVQTLEGTYQVLAMGPVAALEIIKHLGTNGGGFFGANSATPMENPTILSNLIELYSMMLLPGACVITFGKMVGDGRRQQQKNKAPETLLPAHRERITARLFGQEGRSIFLAMGILFLAGLSLCCWAEMQGNPALAEIGLSQAAGSMEGKEVRFGVAQSALFTTVTTSFTTGTVNNMHDTLTPLGGMVPLLHMMLNCVFGGKGVGLMNMILYAILAVFICGLMVGRTPEYLGKKVEGREMKLTALAIIIHPLLILSFSALAVATSAGQTGVTNPSFHGLTQILYEYASSAANNGSGFEGLADNTFFWNITTGIVMFLGRYLPIVIQLAIAGSLMKKNYINESAGTLRTSTVSFAVILVFVVYIFAALTFFPALVLGPISEHLTLWG